MRRHLAVIAVALPLFGLSSAAIASAAPTDNAYLTTIRNQGVPIYGDGYVIALGKKVCQTARKYPSMNVVDLAMGSVTSETGPSPYDYAQARVIVASALANYCPEAR